MCGICGVFSPRRGTPVAGIARMMADTLRHRGPDDASVWADPMEGVALGHRRLAILDLSPAGAQPMQSACGRYVIVFNGEIYNHLTMRDELKKVGVVPAWRGNSDTETLLTAVSHWGLREALRRAFGMFALALWDKQARQIYLARDRMGEKPLYIARLSEGWAFASEVKALLAVPNFEARLCRDAVAAYLAYGYVPDTQCIFQSVQKVKPGHVSIVTLAADVPETSPYETFGQLIDSSLGQRDTRQGDGIDALETILSKVIEEQMLSDVPLGCFLSGGVDSSLVAALMQTRSAQPVRTFSIGFQEARFNEAPYAAAVARHLGTEHTEFMLTEQDALDVITDMPKIYDEPFADSSQIPTALLCREARNFVTVALTGDGGDEIFGGYNRHVIGPQLLSRLQRVPPGLRRIVGRIVSTYAPAITAENGWPRRFASKMHWPMTALDKAATLAPQLGYIDDLPALYQYFTRGIQNPQDLIRGGTTVTNSAPAFLIGGAEWMMAMDSVTYLPGDILVKVDRAAMAASLETRAPFIDARVISAAWALPLEMKIAHGKGKQALRTILYRHVPRELIERPKQGFSIPLDRWLRGALRGWGEELLSDDVLFDLAGLEPAPIFEFWRLHQSGKANNGTKLWTILMLLDWLRHYRHGVVRARSPDFYLP
jgi:asparagine synthase (glutamine-hydrolysing)